jgi:hypothetical protein
MMQSLDIHWKDVQALELPGHCRSGCTTVSHLYVDDSATPDESSASTRRYRAEMGLSISHRHQTPHPPGRLLQDPNLMRTSKTPRNITHREYVRPPDTKPLLQKTVRRAVEKIGTRILPEFWSIAQGISHLFHFASSHRTYLTRPAGQIRLQYSQCQILQAQYRCLASRRGFTSQRVQITER